MERDPERRKDEPTPAAPRSEQEEKERPRRRPRWLRDAEVERSVNAAVPDADYDR
jgi:hypothetical protein